MKNNISKSRNQRSKKLFKSARQFRKGSSPVPFSRILLALPLWILTMVALHYGGSPEHTRLTLGQRSPSTLVAISDFECRDVAKTELVRWQATDSVLPVFSANKTPYITATRYMDLLIDQVVEARKAFTNQINPSAPLPALNQLGPQKIPINPRDIFAVIPPGKEEKIRNVIKETLARIGEKGVKTRTEKNPLLKKKVRHEHIALQRGNTENLEIVSLHHLNLPEQALAAAVRTLQQKNPSPASSGPVWSALLAPWIRPNLVYEAEQTAQKRERAAEAVVPAMKVIRSGTTLVEVGERITPQIIEQLKAHKRKLAQRLSPYERAWEITGNALLCFLILMVCGGLLHMLSPTVLQSKSSTILWGFLSLQPLLWTRLLLSWADKGSFIDTGSVEYLAPLALAPMLGSILLGGPAAIVLGLWSSFLVSLLLGHDFSLFSMGLSITVVAAYGMHGIHRRARFFQTALWVGVTKMFFAIGMGLWEQYAGPTLLTHAFSGLISGFFTAFIALLMLPICEMIFGVTTDIRLLELSDMSHPLLQRLAVEAPGTYHHSLMVAHIAQAAASEIGANPLLTSVCAYYHDIGKLIKPEFFVENTQYRANPHDDLVPSMSTLIIIAHVKEGLSLALRHKLPRPILDGIQQHHGTGLVSFFYHRARKQLELDLAPNARKNHENSLDDKDFRYPGPKPSRPEMGILLLADSIEAASRSMARPTPGKIENLVADIIDERLRDGQLDECNLTFAQLTAVRKSIIFTLTNMLHGRIPYPDDENRNSEPTEKVLHAFFQPQTPDPVDDGTGSTR